MMDWFKTYSGASTDPKFQLIAYKSKLKTSEIAVLWWCFLDYANSESERGSVAGIDFESIDFFYQFEPGTSQRAFIAFKEKGMIVDDKISNWEKRQKSDAAERQKKYRDKKRDRNVTLHNAVTPLLEENRIEEIRIEEIKEDTPVGAQAPDLDKLLFDTGKQLLGNKAGGVITKLKKAKGTGGALDVLEAAKGRNDPMEFVQGAMRVKSKPKPTYDFSHMYDENGDLKKTSYQIADEKRKAEKNG